MVGNPVGIDMTPHLMLICCYPPPFLKKQQQQQQLDMALSPHHKLTAHPQHMALIRLHSHPMDSSHLIPAILSSQPAPALEGKCLGEGS